MLNIVLESRLANASLYPFGLFLFSRRPFARLSPPVHSVCLYFLHIFPFLLLIRLFSRSCRTRYYETERNISRGADGKLLARWGT